MSVFTVVPTIELHESGGFALRIRSVDSQQAWCKWYETERNAYTDAVDLGVATEQLEQLVGRRGATLRRRLKDDVSIDVERLELFGLRKTI